MKAISELAELWGGLRRSSIWAPGLLVQSLASPKQLEWARLKYKQESQRAEPGWHPRLPYLKCRHTGERVETRPFVAGVAGVRRQARTGRQPSMVN